MWSWWNINLPNVNKKMKPRWLGPVPIAQANYQRNNYPVKLSSNYELHDIHKTFHIAPLKPNRKNNFHEFPQRHYSESGPMKDVRSEVEKAVNFRFSHLQREPLYQIRWKGYLLRQDQAIHSAETDVEVKFRLWQEADL